MPFDGEYQPLYVIARIFTLALTVLVILKFEMFDLENVVQLMEYNIRHGPIRGRILTSMKIIIEHFSLALTVFQILSFQI